MGSVYSITFLGNFLSLWNAFSCAFSFSGKENTVQKLTHTKGKIHFWSFSFLSQEELICSFLTFSFLEDLFVAPTSSYLHQFFQGRPYFLFSALHTCITFLIYELLCFINFIAVIQSLSLIRLCDPMNCNTPGSPVLHHLTELAYVHWVNNTIQPSHPLSPLSPALNPSQHQGLFWWVDSSHQVAKVLELQLQHQSFQWNISSIFWYIKANFYH